MRTVKSNTKIRQRKVPSDNEMSEMAKINLYLFAIIQIL